MTGEEIRKLLALGEGQRIEFNATCGTVAALGKVVCGMLNTSGGYIVCGVADDHVVSGVSLKEGQLAILERQLHDGLSPKALVSVEELQLQQKTVVVIEVPKGQDVPYAFQDVFYIREGDRDQKANAETIRDMVMRRQIAPELRSVDCPWRILRQNWTKMRSFGQFEMLREAIARGFVMQVMRRWCWRIFPLQSMGVSQTVGTSYSH
jgi:hypothetical protein